VAENPSTPVATLELLARDSSASVRKAAYNNPNATDEIRAQAVLLGVEEDEDD
jgi:cobalamin biosynthesis protein CbiD